MVQCDVVGRLAWPGFPEKHGQEGCKDEKAGKVVFLAALLLVMTACAASQDAAPDGTAAVGAIFVNDAQELPENEKVYAAFADNSYAFALDAAYVYFFSAGAEVAYAGDENFVSMTFGADLDGDTVGAEASLPMRGRNMAKIPSRDISCTTTAKASILIRAPVLPGRKSPTGAS